MKKITHKQASYFVNAITLYRIVAAPFLLILIFTGGYDIFKWLLGVSFFTDMIDGFLARKYKVSSVLGAKLDSIGDDLTVLVGIIALFVTKIEFVKEHKFILISLLLLFIVQVVYAFLRYRKMTSFHTYLAKIAALSQGIFLIFCFLTGPNLILFYAAAIITIVELMEEIILVKLLPDWETNVKGIYWVLKKRRQK